MTFSIYLGFGIYEDLAGTTTYFYFVITNLNPNVNYTIQVESEIPYSTQIISSTTYHFLESNEVTEFTVMINNISQPTYILIGVILMIITLLVLVVIIVVVTCYMKKRRTVKHTITPNPPTNPILLELPAHANDIYKQVADNTPAYMPEKEKEKIELKMDKISRSNITYSNKSQV